MSKKEFSLLLSALWPGLGHIYLKKPLGILFFFIWIFVISVLLQTILPIQMFQFLGWLYFFGLIIAIIIWLAIFLDNVIILKKEKELHYSLKFLIPFLLLMSLFAYLTLPLKLRILPFQSQSISVGNLHTHSTCSDGKNSYEDMIAEAIKLNFNFIGLTDHNFGIENGCPALQKCSAEDRLLCLPGQEVSGVVHILAIGAGSYISEKQPIKQIVEKIHQQGGLAIAAHPFMINELFGARQLGLPDELRNYTEDELINSGFDAMECDRGTLKDNIYQNNLSQKFHLPCVYNSDAHSTSMLRNVYNSCPGNIKTFNELKTAIKSGQCSEFSPIDTQVFNILTYF